MKKIALYACASLCSVSLLLNPILVFGADIEVSNNNVALQNEEEHITQTNDIFEESSETTAQILENVLYENEEVNTTNELNHTLDLTASSVVLMEASTGEVLYELDAHNQLPPASVTKIMTMLLIMEALEAEKIQLEEEVVVSEYAASMGGSQVYLEPGERQTVETMIKCIAVSSANDACVAMAEHIGGTEEAFVVSMNEKAKTLGMNNTNFVNCNGLDVEGHLTTSYDIALMSQELMNEHPEIQEYTSIWMEDITHVTSKGSSQFGLSNTNKLLRTYEYTTGLKTGYTSLAKSCISATARKNEIDLIAVVMGAPSSADRNRDAIKLLDYGFSRCQMYTDNDKINIEKQEVIGGEENSIKGEVLEPFTYVDTQGRDLKSIEKKITYNKELQAPIKKGDVIGKVEYYFGKECIGSTEINAVKTIDEMSFAFAMKEVCKYFSIE